MPIFFNEHGQPIGPADQACDEFSKFLGTIAHEHSWAPLIYINWHNVPDKDKMWEYVNVSMYSCISISFVCLLNCSLFSLCLSCSSSSCSRSFSSPDTYICLVLLLFFTIFHLPSSSFLLHRYRPFSASLRPCFFFFFPLFSTRFYSLFLLLCFSSAICELTSLLFFSSLASCCFDWGALFCFLSFFRLFFVK